MSTSFLFPDYDRFDGNLNGQPNIRKGPERLKGYRSLFGSQYIRHRSSIPSDGLTFRDFLSNPVKNTKISDSDATGEILSYDKVMSSATNPSFLNLDINSGLDEGEDVNRDILEVEGILSKNQEQNNATRSKSVYSHQGENSKAKSKNLFHIETYGCQMNIADSDVVRSILLEAGYLYTDSPASADIILLNTCAIRDKAEQRIKGRLGEMFECKKKI